MKKKNCNKFYRNLAQGDFSDGLLQIFILRCSLSKLSVFYLGQS